MCTSVITASIVAQHDLLAYKFVSRLNSNSYESWVNPIDRTYEDSVATRGMPYQGNGHVKTYEIGIQSISARPGMYCYSNQEAAVQKIEYGYFVRKPALIMVKIPRGSRLYEGIDGHIGVLLVEKLIPIMEIKVNVR